MVKIWAKIYRDKKIAKSLIYERPEPFRTESMFSYLADICEQLDIPVPVLLSTHTRHFSEFNNLRLRASAFVESVDFDCLQLENIAE